MADETIYIKAEKNCIVSQKKVYLRDIVKLYGSDKAAVKEIGACLVMNVERENRAKYCFSILKLMELIHKKRPGVQLSNLGETDLIIEYIPPGHKNKTLEYLKTIFVCIAVFMGSAFTIMTFNQDVSIVEVFGMVEELVTGSADGGGRVLEISYSLGLPLGIIVFFNHFFRKKIDTDPTPLQVQLRVYEEDVDDTILKNAQREDRIIE